MLCLILNQGALERPKATPDRPGELPNAQSITLVSRHDAVLLHPGIQMLTEFGSIVFLQIPAELEDAAYIDGANRLQIWWRIFLPLSLPALLTVAIFTFQSTWNDFYGPLIFLTGRENYTLSIGINLFYGSMAAGATGSEIQYMMAIALLMTLPMIVVFFLAQRYFIGGIVLTGVNR